jgi:hypothetical protein
MNANILRANIERSIEVNGRLVAACLPTLSVFAPVPGSGTRPENSWSAPVESRMSNS